jgi:HAD superfamily hydrolase (TIGR01509 family)
VDVAVLWDLDGTLADTEQAHFAAWQRFCREFNRELAWEEFKPTFGLGNPDILHRLLGPDLDADEIEALSQRKEALFRTVTGGVIRPMPGARALAEHLDRIGIPQAIVSSAPVENIAFMLRGLGLDTLFATTVSRWDVPNGKPAPDIFLRAAEKLAVPPRQCLVLEDAPAGVQAAHAGGMRCIALVSTWPESSLAHADLLVRDLAQLLWTRSEWEGFVSGGWYPPPLSPAAHVQD